MRGARARAWHETETGLGTASLKSSDSAIREGFLPPPLTPRAIRGTELWPLGGTKEGEGGRQGTASGLSIRGSGTNSLEAYSTVRAACGDAARKCVLHVGMSGASHMVRQEVAALAQNRSGLLAFARLAEAAERDDDMVEAMTALLRLAAGTALTRASSLRRACLLARVCHVPHARLTLRAGCQAPSAWCSVLRSRPRAASCVTHTELPPLWCCEGALSQRCAKDVCSVTGPTSLPTSSC